MEGLETKATQRYVLARWNWQTNITDATSSIFQKEAEAASKLSKELGKEAQQFDLDQIQTAEVRRKIKSIRSLSTAALSATKLSQFLNVTSSMSDIYRYANANLVQLTTARLAEWSSARGCVPPSHIPSHATSCATVPLKLEGWFSISDSSLMSQNVFLQIIFMFPARQR